MGRHAALLSTINGKRKIIYKGVNYHLNCFLQMGPTDGAIILWLESKKVFTVPTLSEQRKG
jgi:hypothetical protein